MRSVNSESSRGGLTDFFAFEYADFAAEGGLSKSPSKPGREEGGLACIVLLPLSGTLALDLTVDDFLAAGVDAVAVRLVGLDGRTLPTARVFMVELRTLEAELLESLDPGRLGLASEDRGLEGAIGLCGEKKLDLRLSLGEAGM